MNTSMRIVYFWILSIILLLSCSVDDADPVNIEDYVAEFASNATKTESGLYYIADRTTGSIPASETDFVQFNFRQYDLNRREVANSYESGLALGFQLNELLDGLVEGMQLMGEGDKYTFIVPPSLSGGVITSGGVVYEIEMVKIFESLEDYNDQEISDYINVNNVSAVRTENGMYVSIIEEGEDPKPVSTSTVTVQYRGYFLNGNIFDEGDNISFPLNGVIQGWTEGLQLIGTGGSMTLFIPSNLAYGSSGQSTIPPNTPLIFDIELKSIN